MHRVVLTSIVLISTVYLIGNHCTITMLHLSKRVTISGVDHKFHWADAVIDGNSIIVSSPEVAFPIAVRYAWADNPICNLYNGVNLPASLSVQMTGGVLLMVINRYSCFDLPSEIDVTHKKNHEQTHLFSDLLFFSTGIYAQMKDLVQYVNTLQGIDSFRIKL